MKRLKGLIVCAALCLAVLCLSTGCGKKENADGLSEVKLCEVAHSYFYAPMYVAIEKGYFKEEGIDLKLTNGSGADNVMAALVSGEADIGFMGSEQSIYVYNQGMKDHVVNFARLTKRAGNFLVVRKGVEYKTLPDGTFDFNSLVGKKVIGGRQGGMPEMVFEYILDKQGIKKSDVNIIQNIDFGYTGQAFAGGEGDYTIEFEPAASSLVKDGYGEIAASLGMASGYVPYTAYCAKGSYIEKNEETIRKFTKALERGLAFVNENDAETISEVIAPQFKGMDKDTIAAGIKNYKEQGTWTENLVFEESDYNLLLDILEFSDMIEKRPDFSKLVTNKYLSKK